MGYQMREVKFNVQQMPERYSAIQRRINAGYNGAVNFEPVFLGIQDEYTPSKLAILALNQVNDVCPLAGLNSILVTFNPEFVNELVYRFNIPMDKIFFLSDHPRKYKFVKQIGIPETNLIEYEYPDELPTREELGMKFDLVIGNPPYQKMSNTAVESANASALYNKFVEVFTGYADVSTMIIPAAWFQSTVAQLSEFREFMLAQNITHITDFPRSQDAFKGVDKKGGVCIYTIQNQKEKATTQYRQFDDTKGVFFNQKFSDWVEMDIRSVEYIFVRNPVYYTVLGKLGAYESMSTIVSSTKPFGIETNSPVFREGGDYVVYVSRNQGNIQYMEKGDLKQGLEMVNKHKVYITRSAEGAQTFPNKVMGRCFYGEPGSVCSATFLVAGVFDSKEECDNLISYLNTKFVRFLISTLKVTQDVLKKVYRHVPIQNWNESWTDEKLYAKYNLTQAEIDKIEEMILPV